MKIRFGILPIISPLKPGGTEFEEDIENYLRLLEQLGGKLLSENDLNNQLPLFYLITTGGTEQKLLQLHAKRLQSNFDEPVRLIAIQGYNSLPASLEVLAKLQQDQQKGRIFFLNGVDDKEGFKQLETTLCDMDILGALRQARIGLIGSPSDWLVASSPDPDILQTVWGPKVIPIDMSEITESLPGISPTITSSIQKPLTSGAKEIQEPSPAELSDAIGVYVELKKTVQKYQLDALTIRCFDLVIGQQTTGCFGLSQLNDEGVIAGCEGDLVSTLGMLWVKLLLKKTPWMANPAQLNETSNTLLLAHCTVPRCLVQDYSLRSHFESGLGVGIQGTYPLGPVTLLRIGGAKLDKIWLAEGEIIRTGNSELHCRTQVEIQLSRGTIRDLLNAPLGNHLIMVQGHHLDRLNVWWRTMIAPTM